MRKSRWAIAVLIIALGFMSSAPTAHAAQRDSVSFFYADLAPYGHWVDHPIYGMVFVPDYHEPGWAPYTDGRWVWTADYG
jgi:hypothetical protein